MKLMRVIFFFILIVQSCKTSNNSSEPKWGYVESDLQPHILIRQPGGTEIRVCGAHFSEISWAIKKWASAIGRTFIYNESCSNPTIRSYGREESFAQSECGKSGLEGRAFARPTAVPMQVVDCGFDGDIRLALLHEVGHLWGLCDQYPGEIDHCTFSTEPDPDSVMASGQSDSLTSDDIDGIRSLAQKFPEAAAKDQHF
ncbi:MAG: hypothetical protein AB7T49_14260 [Oligoflexales bacterium]